MNVAGRGSFRRVHVAVRIEPDDSDPVFVLVVIGGESRHAAYRYRMVSTEDDRDRAFFESASTWRAKVWQAAAISASISASGR